jgi:hypothetical protein
MHAQARNRAQARFSSASRPAHGPAQEVPRRNQIRSGPPAGDSASGWEPSAFSDAGALVEVLKELVRGAFDGLVAPFGGTEQDGDDPGAVDPSKVTEDEGVARLRLVGGPVRQAEVPSTVFRPRMRLEEPVLVDGARLALGPSPSGGRTAGAR